EMKVGALTPESIAQNGINTAIWDILTTSVNLGRKFAYRNRELPVYIDDKEGNVTVRCRLNVLRHAFAEIISNAIAFSPDDGQLDVVQWVEDGNIFVSVKDPGPGIPAQAIETVFKEFEQIDRQRQERQGLGLGLPLARKVIETH